MKDNKTGPYFPYLFILGVVGIVAIVGLLITEGLSGALIYKIAINEYQTPCTDDDPDNNYNQFGLVTHGRIQFADHCVDNRVYQYVCASSNTVRLTTGYECVNGCLDGACLAAPAEASQ